MDALKGKTALVTGASRGIGKAVSVMLAKNGVNLAVNSSSSGNLNAAESELSAYGVKVLACPGNLADPETPREIIKKAAGYFGGIDILINNAGITLSRSIAETTTDEWDLLMAVNSRAPFLLCREAIPYLKKSDHGTIINISSVVGYKGYVNQGAYASSKHALTGMTKVLAQEVFEDGIRVHLIAPGGVATDMVSRVRPDLEVSMLTTPEEIADIVQFVLTHRGNAVIDEINVHRHSNTPWK